MTQTIFPQQFTIDTVANTAAIEISQNQHIPSGSSFAVISLRSLSDEFSSHVITRLESALLNAGKIKIVSRQRIEAVLQEQTFGLSGYIDDNSAQRIGHLLGANFVLAGNISKLGNKFSMDIQVMETETGLLIYSKIFEIASSELRDYERIVVEREREEQRERDRLAREEINRQREAENRIKALERKRKVDAFLADERRLWSVGARIGSPSLLPIVVGYAGLPVGTGILAYGIYDDSYFVFDLADYLFWIWVPSALSSGTLYILAATGVISWDWFSPFYPVFVPNVNFTLAPFPNSFLELGVDMSIGNPNGAAGNDYMSLFPYAHYNFGLPIDGISIGDEIAPYFGIGAGRMFTFIGSPERNNAYDGIHDTFAMDFVVGVKGINKFDIQGVFRYDFQGGYYFNIMFGYSHKFE